MIRSKQFTEDILHAAKLLIGQAINTLNEISASLIAPKYKLMRIKITIMSDLQK